MKIISQAFKNGTSIPQKYTGEGEDISPPFHIEAVPKEAKSLALIMDDPDAPMGTFDHWIGWNIPSNWQEFKEGEELPNQGTNHFGDLKYRGPMPPKGHGTHHYHFKLFALDKIFDLADGISKEDLQRAMKGHILAQSEWIGTYER